MLEERLMIAESLNPFFIRGVFVTLVPFKNWRSAVKGLNPFFIRGVFVTVLFRPWVLLLNLVPSQSLLYQGCFCNQEKKKTK